MQPRRDVLPVRGETVFHVTNNGDSVMAGSVESRDVVDVAAVSVESDMLEDEEDEPLDETSATRRRAGILFLMLSSFEEGPSSSSATLALALLYSTHDFSISSRVSDSRLSR